MTGIGDSRAAGAEAQMILFALRGAEAPLFHGCTYAFRTYIFVHILGEDSHVSKARHGAPSSNITLESSALLELYVGAEGGD